MCVAVVSRVLEKLDAKSLTETYGQFFTALWNTGRQKKVTGGRIIYTRMAPPWLHSPVVLVHRQKPKCVDSLHAKRTSYQKLNT